LCRLVDFEGGTMNIKSLTDSAKNLIHKRGGVESVEEDAKELKDIATKDESLTDKGKDAVEAVKDPGAPGDDTPASPSTPA
jgi:hypothetical protein